MTTMTDSLGEFVEDGSFLVLQNSDGDFQSVNGSPPNYNALSMVDNQDSNAPRPGLNGFQNNISSDEENTAEQMSESNQQSSNRLPDLSSEMDRAQNGGENNASFVSASSVSTSSEISSAIEQLTQMTEEKEKYKGIYPLFFKHIFLSSLYIC